jgi:hypothetical protein
LIVDFAIIAGPGAHGRKFRERFRIPPDNTPEPTSDDTPETLSKDQIARVWLVMLAFATGLVSDGDVDGGFRPSDLVGKFVSAEIVKNRGLLRLHPPDDPAL